MTGRIGTLLGRLRAFAMRTRTQWNDYPLREGMRIADGRFVIERHIGTGSFGLAYVALERRTGRRRLLKHNKPSKGELGLELLLREGRWLERIDHPGVPALVDRFEHRGRSWLAMELIEGRNLEELLCEDEMRFDERHTLELLIRLADILSHVHAQGIVHLDVRLPNVIVREGGELSLVDFGLAREIGERIPLLDDAEGLQLPDGASQLPFGETKRRMRQPVVQSDLYALGHLALFLLYSTFDAPAPEAGLADGAERGWEEELRLSAATAKIVRRLLQVEAPYDSVAELAADAAGCLETLPRAR